MAKERQKLSETAIDVASAVAATGVTVVLPGPVGQLIGAATPSFINTIHELVAGLIRRRQDNVENMIRIAAKQAGLDPSVLIERLEDSPAKYDLFVRTIKVAQDTSSLTSLVLLARSLFEAIITEEEVRIHIEDNFVRAIDQLGAGHLQLLRLMGEQQKQRSVVRGVEATTFHFGRSEEEIATHFPELKAILPSLLSGLQSNGLIGYKVHILAGVGGGGGGSYWEITDLGKVLLMRLTLVEGIIRTAEGEA